MATKQEGPRQLTTADVAKMAGVSPASIHRYRHREGAIPEPDGYMGSTPWWWRSTINKWLTERLKPGQHREKAADA